MDFVKLQYMVKVADVGNVTRAAEELYMTQSALSHYIARVEKEEDIKIFDRSSNPLSLTYEGKLYIDTARKILNLGLAFSDEIDEIKKNYKGRLIIGIPPARAAHLLPLVLPAYLERFPNVEIQTVEHNSRDLKDDVRKGYVDLAILPELEGFEEFVCKKLFDEELFLVAKKGALRECDYKHRDDGVHVVKIEKLKRQKFILLKPGHGMREAIDAIFALYDLKPDILMETTNNETAYRLATTGLGIAIVPEMNITMLKKLHTIEMFHLSETGISWTISAIVRRSGYVSFLAKEFIRMVKKVYGNDEDEELL